MRFIFTIVIIILNLNFIEFHSNYIEFHTIRFDQRNSIMKRKTVFAIARDALFAYPSTLLSRI